MGKVDLLVYASPDEYLETAAVYRTEREVICSFQVQSLAELRAVDTHPHWHPFAHTRWVISRDSGLTWLVSEAPPHVDRVVDASVNTAALRDGGTVTLTFDLRPQKYAVIQRGTVGHGDYTMEYPGKVAEYELSDLGPFAELFPYNLTRTSDGALLAAGYGALRGATSKNWTVAFLRSTDEGRSWHYLSHIANPFPFALDEPDILGGPDGDVLAVMRVDWHFVPKEQWPADANSAGPDNNLPPAYGYYLYQSRSHDFGRTWSEPIQLPLWGHPPELVRLQSGNILLLWGHRRPPYSIRAILSRDGGKTWDPDTFRTVHTFDPGGVDMGYPKATQLDDGTIVCSYYGNTTPDTSWKSPRGLYVSVFDESG